MSGNLEQLTYNQIASNNKGETDYQKPPLRRRAGYLAASAVLWSVGIYAAAKGVGHAVDAGWLHSWANLTDLSHPIAGTAMHGFADFAQDTVDKVSWFKDAALDNAGNVVDALMHPVKTYDKLKDPDTWMNKTVGLWSVVSLVTGTVTAAVFHRSGHKKDEELAREQMSKKDGFKAMAMAAPRTLWKHRMKAGVIAAAVVSAVLVDHVDVNTIIEGLNNHWIGMGGGALVAGAISRLSFTGSPTDEEINRPPDNFPRPSRESAKNKKTTEAVWMAAYQRNRARRSN
jgi:hypothetical protein